QPFRLRLVLQCRAVLGRECCPDRLEVVAGIEPFRYGADVLSPRLAITQERGARERVNLRAGIVDIVFAGDVEARAREQIGERVAEYRPATVPDMHRSGRIGGYVFDVNGGTTAHIAAPIVLAGGKDRAQCVDPCRRLEREVDETRPSDLRLRYDIVAAQF